MSKFEERVRGVVGAFILLAVTVFANILANAI